jgi:hypothetical protein
MYTRQHGLEANLFLAPGEEAAPSADEPAAEGGGAGRAGAALAILRRGGE